MRRYQLAMLLGIAIILAPVQALEYEEKPHISVSMLGSVQLAKGEERSILLTIFNDAKRVKVKYKDEVEAGFFKNEEMLFTAYNLSIELLGNEALKVETPPQRLAALPPMQPVTLQFVIKVSENASPGTHDLVARISYERIDKLKRLEVFPLHKLPREFKTSLSRLVRDVFMTNATITNTTIYEYELMTKEYRLEYSGETQEVYLKLFVMEEEVKLRVLNVSTDSLVGGGKGKVEIELMNSGEKTAKNAYVILETPSGFEASALGISQPAPSLPELPSVPQGMPGVVPVQIPGGISPTPLPETKAAYYIGDLRPGEKASVTFYLRIDVKDEGYYPLNLKAFYIDESGSLKESEAVPFGIKVERAPELIVKEVESKVFANARGEVRVKITSTAELKDVTLSLRANPPISVLSSDYYLGDLEKGEERTAVFKVKASSEAKALPYPAELRMKYRTMDEYSETNPVKIGIVVSPKLEFELEGKPSINAGDERVVEFWIRNTGSYEVRDATARLTILDPFSSTDDTAFIGNLKPGESSTIRFKLKADREATPKLYALNLEVKYRDPEGEWVISEPVKATIEVLPRKTSFLPALLAGAVVIGAVVLAYRRLRK